MGLTRAVLPGSSAPSPSQAPVAVTRATHAAPALPRTLWLLAAAHFAQVVTVPAVRQLFDTGLVYEPISARQAPSTLVPVIPTMDFHSEALLAATVTARTFPRDIRAVIYDNERFPNTPRVEQERIVQYTAKAAAVATAHHLQSICDFIQPDRLPVAQRHPVNEVPACSIIGLNTVQQSERNPTTYRRVVSQEVAVIRVVRPHALIIAGLSANPRGTSVTARELTMDMEAVAPMVNGFWLNVPAPGVGCPQCHQPDPQVMARALAALPHDFRTGTALSPRV